MKRMLISLALVALPLASGCSESQASDEARPDAPAVQKAERAAGENGALRVQSTVKGIAFTRLDTLPKAPAGRHDCDNYVIAPHSAAGKKVASAGWGVTGEERIGRFQAVSFAASFEPSTSGTCFVGKGNVGIFDGGELIALAYAAGGSDMSIGSVHPFENDGLRIWDGGVLAGPVADIRSAGNRLSVVELASEERFCRGKSVVPKIYGMPIGKARQALLRNGWSPVPYAGTEGRWLREAELAKAGFEEVASCAGTGFAFCGFDYKRSGARLTVVTAGEDEQPLVSGYQVECGD